MRRRKQAENERTTTGNSVVKRSVRIEQTQTLEQEASEFFKAEGHDSKRERHAYQRASLRVIGRD